MRALAAKEGKHESTVHGSDPKASGRRERLTYPSGGRDRLWGRSPRSACGCVWKRAGRTGRDCRSILQLRVAVSNGWRSMLARWGNARTLTLEHGNACRIVWPSTSPAPSILITSADPQAQVATSEASNCQQAMPTARQWG